MLPLKDHNPSGSFPIITYTLIAINSVVFFYMTSLSETALDGFINTYAIIPRAITNGQDLYTLMTAMFLHGSFMHILGNMLFLNIFGDNLEDRFGHLLYLIFYIGCGLAASFAQILLSPESTIPNIGASGAIAGLMGGYLILFPKHKIDVLLPLGGFLRTASVPAFTMLFYWIAIQLFSGIGQLGIPESGGVAYWAHTGGFVIGLLLTFILKPFTSPRVRSLID